MTGAFLRFQRENKPLSGYLMQRYARPAEGRVASMGLSELVDVGAVVERLVEEYRLPPPRLGPMELDVRKHGIDQPTEELGRRRPTVRQYLRFPVIGDVEALDQWPDEAGPDLQAVDDGYPSPTPPAPGEPDDAAAAFERYEALNASQRWTVAGTDDPQRPPGLHTFLAFAAADITEAGRRGNIGDLGPQVRALLERVEPIINALAEQHRDFFDRVLPALLRASVLDRRHWLGGLEAIETGLGFPPGWKASPPALSTTETVPPTAEVPPTTASAGPGDTGADEVRLPGAPKRLADASFEDLLQTVRVWTDAVERHPLAYRLLPEERISDLLVASLNAALPGAKREVFSRGGRTDLYVDANVLPGGGRAPARVFIGECKKWTGPCSALKALTQMLGYLEVHDTAALLVLLIGNKKFAVAERDAVRCLRSREDCAGESATPVEGWPILHVRADERLVRVCVATINISEPPAHPDSPRRRGDAGETSHT